RQINRAELGRLRRTRMRRANEVNERIRGSDTRSPVRRVERVADDGFGTRGQPAHRLRAHECTDGVTSPDKQIDQRAAQVPGAAGHENVVTTHPPGGYLNRSSNALRALGGADDDFVSRSIVVRGS